MASSRGKAPNEGQRERRFRFIVATTYTKDAANKWILDTRAPPRFLFASRDDEEHETVRSLLRRLPGQRVKDVCINTVTPTTSTSTEAAAVATEARNVGSGSSAVSHGAMVKSPRRDTDETPRGSVVARIRPKQNSVPCQTDESREENLYVGETGKELSYVDDVEKRDAFTQTSPKTHYVRNDRDLSRGQTEAKGNPDGFLGNREPHPNRRSNSCYSDPHSTGNYRKVYYGGPGKTTEQRKNFKQNTGNRDNGSNLYDSRKPVGRQYSRHAENKTAKKKNGKVSASSRSKNYKTNVKLQKSFTERPPGRQTSQYRRPYRCSDDAVTSNGRRKMVDVTRRRSDDGNVTVVTIARRRVLMCRMCKVFGDSTKSMSAHLKGARHSKALARQAMEGVGRNLDGGKRGGGDTPRDDSKNRVVCCTENNNENILYNNFSINNDNCNNCMHVSFECHYPVS